VFDGDTAVRAEPMSSVESLPHLEDCVDLYLAAHEQHGENRFTASQVESPPTRAQRERLLDLGVAYGFLSWDGVTYRVRLAPDAPHARWRTAVGDRTERLRDVVTTRAGASTDDQKRAMSAGEPSEVVVTGDDDFETVIRTVADLEPRPGDEIILRSAGEHANTVQRIADRLCHRDGDDVSPKTTFEKEGSEVVGDDKNTLEFKLFLRVS
jgi:hypothetical protein